MERINYNWVLECALLCYDKPNLAYLKEVGASETEAQLGLLIHNFLTKPINQAPPKPQLSKEQEEKAQFFKAMGYTPTWH